MINKKTALGTYSILLALSLSSSNNKVETDVGRDKYPVDLNIKRKIERHIDFIQEERMRQNYNKLELDREKKIAEIKIKEREEYLREKEEQKKKELKIKLASRGNYNHNNLTIPSNISVEKLKHKLKGTPLEDVAPAYIQAEREYGINALFLCAISIQESNWGRSRLAIDKNNIFGFRAYNKSPYSSARGFSSKQECVLVVARFLVKNYLSEGGNYYNGKSIEAVNTKYSLNNDGTPNQEWGRNIKLLMKQLAN